MKAEIKKRYVELLRSSEQTFGYLRTKCGFCALGVLCEIYRQDNLDKSYWDENNNFVVADEGNFEIYVGSLPACILEWSGIEGERFRGIGEGFDFCLNLPPNEHILFLASELNDGVGLPQPVTLADIADLIETQL